MREDKNSSPSLIGIGKGSMKGGNKAMKPNLARSLGYDKMNARQIRRVLKKPSIQRELLARGITQKQIQEAIKNENK